MNNEQDLIQTEIENQEEDIEFFDNIISILDLLINKKLNEINERHNFSIILDTFNILYLPSQFFNMSSTKERLNNIFDLSQYEYNKLVTLYKMAVLHADFDKLYELEPENNEHEIAEKILEFDIEYWNSQSTYKQLYQNLLQTFAQSYSLERVVSLIED